MAQLTRTTQRGVAPPPTPAGIGPLQINSPPLSPEVTLGYLLGSWQSITNVPSNPDLFLKVFLLSLFVSRFITWVNIEKFRSGNLLESGDKNRWNLPCGELLLSLICTRSFGKNSLLHLSFKETLFLETCLQNKDNSNSPHGKFHPVSLVYLCFNQMATILWDFPWK